MTDRYEKEKTISQAHETPKHRIQKLRGAGPGRKLRYEAIHAWKDHVGSRVLDVGCDIGDVLCCMLEDFPQIVGGTGITLSEAAVERYREQVVSLFDKSVTNRISIVVEDGMNMSFEDKSFDTIVTLHTLEHIYEDDLPKMVSEFRRVLDDGGHVIVSVPYENCIPSKNHVTRFNEDSLPKLFESNGFKTLDVRLTKPDIAVLFEKSGYENTDSG